MARHSGVQGSNETVERCRARGRCRSPGLPGRWSWSCRRSSSRWKCCSGPACASARSWGAQGGRRAPGQWTSPASRTCQHPASGSSFVLSESLESTQACHISIPSTPGGRFRHIRRRPERLYPFRDEGQSATRPYCTPFCAAFTLSPLLVSNGSAPGGRWPGKSPGHGP